MDHGDDDAPTPPLERRGEPYDDVKTPPLERVAAGELEGQPPVPEKEALPKVMAPVVEDAPTIPGLDLLGRRNHDSAPGVDADLTDADQMRLDPTDERRLDVTLEVVAPRGVPRSRWMFLAALVLVATGAGLWLWQRSAPLSPTPAVPVVGPVGAIASDGSTPDHGLDGPLPDLTPEPDAAGEGMPREVTTGATTRRLWLSTHPTGARVHLGGRLLGETPLRGVEIPAGRVVLALSHPGRHERRLPLGAGRRPVRLQGVGLRPRPILVRPAARGVIQVAVRDEVGLVAADVYLDGKKIGQSPLNFPGVRAGPHQVQARRAGYETATRQVHVVPGKDNRVVLMLSRAR